MSVLKIVELYYLLQKTLHYRMNKKPIMLGISGGLDSRVLAGMIRNLGKQIDVGFVYHTNKHYKHLASACRIAGVVNIDKFYNIYVVPREGHCLKQAILKMKKLYPDHQLYEATGMEFLTGTEYNIIMLGRYKKFKKWYFNECRPGEVNFLKELDIIDAFYSEELVEFSNNMKWHEKLHQKLYREMICRYFPDLAKIPRDGMFWPVDSSESIYILDKTINYIKQTGKKHA